MGLVLLHAAGTHLFCGKRRGLEITFFQFSKQQLVFGFCMAKAKYNLHMFTLVYNLGVFPEWVAKGSRFNLGV